METILEKEIGKIGSIILILSIFRGNRCGMSEFCLRIKYFDFQFFLQKCLSSVGCVWKKIFYLLGKFCLEPISEKK